MSTLSNSVLESATKAVFELQYSSAKAARYVCGEVPNTNMETALQAVNKVARPGQ